MKMLTIFQEPISTIVFAGWIISLVLVVGLWLRRYRRVYNVHWYDTSDSGPMEEMTWPQIRKLMKREPLTEEVCGTASSSWRPQRYPVGHLIVDLVGAAACLLFYCGTLELLMNLREQTPNYEGLRSLGILAGSLSVAVGVFGIFYQGRLRARAENRQAWVNSIRSELSNIITNLQSFDTDLKSNEKTSQAHRITKLDLHLNPSERIHRALLALVRLMSGLEVNTLDEDVLTKLSDNDKPLTSATSKTEWNTRKCYIIRLSTVLLKREWEQVKHVR